MAGEGGKKVITPARPRKKSANPRPTVAAAARLYRKFIGKPAAQVTRHETKHPAAASSPGGKLPVARLARAVTYLKIRNSSIRDGMIRFRPHERPMLASHPGGRQYYILQGNQNLTGVPAAKANPAKLTPAALRRAGLDGYGGALVPLGEVEQIGYYEKKKVENFEPVEYYHDFGEEDGRRPELLYDVRQKQIHLVGGNYRTLANGVNN